MARDESMTCEEFAARLGAALVELCEDWNRTRVVDPEECPELMSLNDWWVHLGTRFPE